MTKEQEEHEEAVTGGMAKAQGIAEQLFGSTAKSNPTATFEIFDYLENGADEEAFATDLKRTVEHAKAAFGTDAPSAEQVFGLFSRMFEIEED